jgi:PAS domain S-box-containing protein
MAQGALDGVRFASFIDRDEEHAYYGFRKALLETGEARSLSLRMHRKDGTPFWACLEANIAEAGDGTTLCRLTLSDISERRELEDFQRFLVTIHGGTGSEPFFEGLARHLAQSLGMDFICIDRLEGDGLTAQTVAVWCDGHFEDNMSYALKDTPCGEVVGKDICCFPASVCRYFPQDQVLLDLRAESYIGVTLWGHTGKPVGLIAMIGRQPMENRALAEAMLKMVAARAAGELERLKVEDTLRESEQNFKNLANNGQALIWTSGTDKNCNYFNEVWLAFTGRTIEQEMGIGWTEGVHPEDLPGCLEVYVGAFDRREAFSMQYRLRRHDGEYRWLLDDGTPRHNSMGEFLGYIGHCLDITAYKEAEIALRNSEGRLRDITFSMADWIWETDADGVYTYSSHKSLDVLGLSREEIIGKTPFDFMSADEAARVASIFNTIAAQKAPIRDLESWNIANNGERICLLTNGVPILDPEGNLKGYRGVDKNITGVKLAESIIEARLRLMRLAESYTLEELLRATLDEAEALTGSQAGFYHFVEPDQATLSLQAWSTNTTATLCTATGAQEHYPVSQAGVWADCLREGRPLIHNDYASLPHRKGLPEGHAPVLRELVVPVRREGAFVAVLGVGNKPTDYTETDLDSVTKLADFAWDIAEHMRAEEALRVAHAHLQCFVDANIIGVIEFNPEGTLLSANHYYLHLLGYTQEEFQAGMIDWQSVTPPEWLATDARALQELRDQGSSSPYEKEYLRRDGTRVPVLLADAALPGEKGHIAAFVLDLTERKRAEEGRLKLEAQLQQAQKMESIGRLAGGVAHDFNNMLAVILGYTEMAVQRLDPKLPLYEDLQEVLTAANRSAALTGQLLAFARKQTVTPKVLNVNETVAEALKMLERMVGENIELDWRPGANLWPVRMDPSQIEQVLTNLCLNARDAIDDIGKVTIATENTNVDDMYCAGRPDFAPGEYVLLEVSDTGSGMETELLAHIFEPFFTTKELGKGTGLGLSMIYGVVKQNHGFIDVCSTSGQGTSFRIYLPRHAGKTVAEPTEGAAAAPTGGPETILLVEDEPALLKITAKTLERFGYTVLAANTPVKALHMAREHAGEIGLLITDVIMPEMNGRDLAKNLLSLYPGMKFMFMSGYTAEIIAHDGELAAGTDFLQKPFSPTQLAVKLDEALGSRRGNAKNPGA